MAAVPYTEITEIIVTDLSQLWEQARAKVLRVASTCVALKEKLLASFYLHAAELFHPWPC